MDDRPLLEQAVEQHALRLVALTEKWCWKAIAQGVGNRVWRSNPITEPWPSTRTTYQFQILKPDEGAPGSGVIFGPWSAACPPSTR